MILVADKQTTFYHCMRNVKCSVLFRVLFGSVALANLVVICRLHSSIYRNWVLMATNRCEVGHCRESI